MTSASLLLTEQQRRFLEVVRNHPHLQLAAGIEVEGLLTGSQKKFLGLIPGQEEIIRGIAEQMGVELP